MRAEEISIVSESEEEFVAGARAAAFFFGMGSWEAGSCAEGAKAAGRAAAVLWGNCDTPAPWRLSSRCRSALGFTRFSPSAIDLF